MKSRTPRIYAMVRKRFATNELQRLGFVRDASRMVKRGACRFELADAYSLDGLSWRVRPFVRHWR